MAQQKKTASTKKILAKKTSPKKTAPKKTGSKATVAMKTKKNTASKKTVARKAAPKKTVAKKASPMKTISKSSEERAERAARRSLSKEGPAAKRAKVDNSPSDLVNLLPTSAPVLGIFAASGSRRLPKEVIKCQELFCLSCDVPFLICTYLKVSLEETNKEVLGEVAFKEVSYELDTLLEASPVSASVLDIIAASGSRPLPKEALLDVAMGVASKEYMLHQFCIFFHFGLMHQFIAGHSCDL